MSAKHPDTNSRFLSCGCRAAALGLKGTDSRADDHLLITFIETADMEEQETRGQDQNCLDSWVV